MISAFDVPLAGYLSRGVEPTGTAVKMQYNTDLVIAHV